MKRKSLFVTVGVVAVLLVAAFLAGKALAYTPCFSDTAGHWAETYICWLKDHLITTGYGDGTYRPDNPITRGEMAAMLQRQVQVPPTTGLVLITPGNGDWLKFLGTDDVGFNNYSNQTHVYKATIGDAYISIQPSIPTVLYGRNMQLVGVEFCYAATTQASLNHVEIDLVSATTGGSTGANLFTDNTNFTDSACRYYVLPAPITLTPSDSVIFFIQIHWTAVGGPTSIFSLGRTTFVLSPTDSMAVFSPPLTDLVMPLSETNAPANGTGTSAP